LAITLYSETKSCINVTRISSKISIII